MTEMERRRPSGRERHAVLNGLALLMVVFLVLFPKGGIKLAGAPLTWGYVLLGLSVLPATIIRFVSLPLLFRPSALVSFGLVLPFQIVLLYAYRQNGTENLGIMVSDFTGFVLFPFLFLLIYPAYLPSIDPARFERCFRFCVFGAAAWGIFLFVWHPLTGSYLEIPFLTVNFGDYGQLEATKHIDRGAFFKLISTYNNGNLYGVATLILFPLYKLLETSRWKRNVVRLALVLTLSRTVWLGLLIEQLLSSVAGGSAMIRSLPHVHLKLARRQFGALLLTFALVFIGFLFTVQSLSFLTDTSFGGRASQFSVFEHPTWLPSLAIGGFSEVMYSSALALFGLIGLVAIVLIFFSPVLLIALFPKLVDAPTNRAAAKGLLLYAIVAGADGSTNLIPVMVFYWFMTMVFLYGMPGEQRGGVMDRFRWGAVNPMRGGAGTGSQQAVSG